MFLCPCWSPSKKGDCLNLDWVIGSSYPIKISINALHNIYKMFSNCLQVCNSDNPHAQHCNHSSSFIAWDLKPWKYLFPCSKSILGGVSTCARHPSFPHTSKFLAPKGCTAKAGTQITFLIWKITKIKLMPHFLSKALFPFYRWEGAGQSREDVWLHWALRILIQVPIFKIPRVSIHFLTLPLWWAVFPGSWPWVSLELHFPFFSLSSGVPGKDPALEGSHRSHFKPIQPFFPFIIKIP